LQVIGARLAALVTALLLMGAAPAARIVPHPGGGPGLVIPPDSLVTFTGFDENGTALFSGEFNLTGKFVYDCPADCEPPMTEEDVELVIIPDPDVAARLPHWQERGDDMVVYIDDIEKVKRQIATRQQVDQLLAGKIPEVIGRLSIVADHYSADFGCDYSPYYAARFVAFSKPPRLSQRPAEPNYGCL
jgi:hypothetical protein